MSTAEPFMPAHWTPPADPASEIDADHDLDILAPDAGPADEAPVTFPDNPVFRTPVPGDALSEEELERDLDEE